MFQLDRQEQQLMDYAIGYWKEQRLIDEELAVKLQASYTVKGFDWRRLAQYSFWIALSCIVLAFLSLFIDKEILELFSRIYNTPDIVISFLFAGIACASYYFGYQNKIKHPEKVFSNESIMLIGVFGTAAAVGYLGKVIGKTDGSYSLIFFLSITIYILLAIKLSSKTIWTFMLIALGIWFATETAYHSNWGFKFWGMNYPMRFCLFGTLLTTFAIFFQSKVGGVQQFTKLTYLIGLLYLLTALWLLSIFGNYSDLNKWAAVKQYHIFYWGLIASAISLFFAWYGLKKKDPIAREVGLTFLLINVYTRYFEYLWDNINRAIFFALLALSFWFIGKWAERLWTGNMAK